jgi:hypothetical protein
MPSSPKKTGTRTVSATAKKVTAKAATAKAATAKKVATAKKAAPAKAAPKKVKAGQLTNGLSHRVTGRNTALANREANRAKAVARFGEAKVRSDEKSDSDSKWGYGVRQRGKANDRFPEDKTSRLKLSPSSPARIAKNSSMRLDDAKKRNNWEDEKRSFHAKGYAKRSSEKLDASKAASKKAAPKKAAPKATRAKPIPRTTRSSKRR